MALTCGVKHLYESLPRVITIWANTGSKLFDIVGSGKTDKNTLAKKDLYVTSFNLFNNNLSTLSVIKTKHLNFNLTFCRKPEQASSPLRLLRLLQQLELENLPSAQTCVHNDPGHFCQSPHSFSPSDAVETCAHVEGIVC